MWHDRERQYMRDTVRKEMGIKRKQNKMRERREVRTEIPPKFDTSSATHINASSPTQGTGS